MAKQRKKSPRARLFVALELPEEIREGLAGWQRAELEPIPVLRPVAAEALHVTLAFLGYLPEREIARIAALLGELGRPAPEVRFLPGPVGRPRGRPRLFAIEAESPGAVELQAEVAGALQRARLYEPEKRDFWPHVTVARARRERRGSNKPAKVAVRPRALPEELTRPFFSRRVRLYRSNLRPQGAQYEPLSSTDLKVST
ncbi:MAG TPA: RNA 2',3'-cyclic phosphodiesterase [Solirubrobacterales bacterium]